MIMLKARKQYVSAISRNAPGVRLGAGNRHSPVAYISIGKTTGKGRKPAVPGISALVLVQHNLPFTLGKLYSHFRPSPVGRETLTNGRNAVDSCHLTKILRT